MLTFPIRPEYRAFIDAVEHELQTTGPLPRFDPRVPVLPRRPEAEISRRERDREFWGVSTIFGRDAFERYHADLASQFWHPEFLRFGYVIGLGTDGDPIVQASSGRHADRIFLTDHAFYHSWEEQLVDGEDLDDIADEIASIGFTTFPEMTADQFFDLMTMDVEMDGLFLPLAASFHEFYLVCCHEYGSDA